ncbi:MAG TPA: hypothetical protein VJM11_01535 [Nevskiaceae bacterium]|nr:hypothetical protein [Nevskiaceae bacterium]
MTTMAPPTDEIRTTPILVVGTVLTVVVAAVVIVRMAPGDDDVAVAAPVAQLSEEPPAEVTPSPTASSPPAAPPVPSASEAGDELLALPAMPVQAVGANKADELAPWVLERPTVARTERPQAPVAAEPPAVQAVWWDAPRPNALNLLYAGYLTDYTAVVLLFDGEFASTDGLDFAIDVKRGDGTKIAGQWRIGPNRKALIFPVPRGTYEVVLGAELTNVEGQVLGRLLGGPVVVR